MKKDLEKKPRKPRKPSGQKSRTNILEFPNLQEQQISGIEVTPLQLLGIILKLALKERITNEEIDKICATYYQTINEIWG